MQERVVEHLIRKYDVPVPRYTSYPTVPHWNTEQFSAAQWKESVIRSFNESNSSKGISLYIHLPFCESLCTYCACNTRITKNHQVEDRYIEAILKEWESYKQLFTARPVLRELHLGGGTPTFFSPVSLYRMLTAILKDVDIHPQHSFSFEGHPSNTTADHLITLYQLGFTRVSYGVQDLDPRVQRAIHRIQPFEQLEAVTTMSREAGYQSISFDLIYGLPYQTLNTVDNTVQSVIALQPDRISFYSYAHVPWLRPGQRGYEDADLPSDVLKRSLYETGRQRFLSAGYRDIGMDHFALPMDSLAAAHREHRLHRNFMGYTDSQTDLLIGLGTSAISDAKYAYAQNLKKVEEYEAAIKMTGNAVFKGHIQSAADLIRKQCILGISCAGTVPKNILDQVMDEALMDRIIEMEAEGLVARTTHGLEVTPTGNTFIRNICSLFDRYLRDRQHTPGVQFSKAI